MKSEDEVQQEIQLEAARHDCILLRNNSGAFYDERGILVRFGLGNHSKKHNKKSKSSDLIGITTIEITPDMVGEKIGVFTAIEVKAEDWKPSEKDKRYVAQHNFVEWVKLKGGIAKVCKSAEELSKLFKK